jgi:hypothetical protein
VSEILELVDMSYDRVLRVLKQEGVFKTKPKSKDDDAQKRILELLDEKNTALEVARQTNVPLTIVNTVKQQSRHGKKEFEYAGKQFATFVDKENYRIELGKEVRKLAEEGLSRKDIADKFGITVLSVARFLD